MRKLFFFAAITLVFFSCSNRQSQAPASTSQTPSEDSIESFFPVTSYLMGQMLEFDSMPTTPLYIKKEGGKTDSVWIKREELKPYLKPFITPVIDSVNLIKYFKETKFNDLSINSVTFAYDADIVLPDTMQVRHWDVYINPEKNSIESIYIIKHIQENGHAIEQQLTWQSGKWAKITSLLIKEDGEKQLEKEEIFIWDLND